MSRDRIISVALSGVAIITVLCGFILGGNPVTARQERRDADRSSTLSETAMLLHNTYVSTRTLPTSTEAYVRLLAERPGALPSSRANEIPEYRWISAEAYELCMTFETDSHRPASAVTRPGLPPQESPDFWAHTQGRTCYPSRIPSWVLQDAATQASSTLVKP
jgi:hypothetical protein